MIYQINFAGRPLKIETNSLASQSSGSALISYGNTVVLGTAAMGDADIEANFLPLTVEYEERYYAAGKIIGSRYMRREGRPSEAAILTARMIDRAIRPGFPENLRREVQVILTVFAFDEENDPDFPALLAASCALLISNIPWDGPMAGVRVGIPGKIASSDDNFNSRSFISSEKPFILNPIYKERGDAKLDLFTAGVTGKNEDIIVNMLDGGAEEVSEDEVFSAIDFSRDHIKTLLSLQEDIRKKEGKPKLDISCLTVKENLDELLKKHYGRIRENLLLSKETSEEMGPSKEKLKTDLALDDFVFKKLTEKTLQEMVLRENIRSDGRKIDEIRQISCRAGILVRTHGSGLFCRGLTKVLSILTLGAPSDELLLEGMEISGKKRFLHHYNFPPYSSGEVKRMGSPSRREIGHGALAEKALRAVIPETEKFPYTIRVVSEVLSSNGSTSMASTCASSLALFDAGVPVKTHVAGISLGLIIRPESVLEPKPSDYKILTDIQGPEDGLGDMDFKVAGTRTGLTAIQLDTKVKGLKIDILKKGLERARKAREKILEEMNKTISKPRPDLSPFAPRILTIRISPEKIREVIGPHGKIINEIIEETDAAIDIEEDGLVFVTAKDPKKGEKAIDWIKNITREIKAGEVFDGRIRKIANFGIFVELLPGQDGLLHVSEILPSQGFGRNNSFLLLKEKFKLGQIIKVRVISIDEEGKMRLSLAA